MNLLLNNINESLLQLPVTLAQGEGPPPTQGINFWLIGLMFAGFWFLIIAPQRKKQKAHTKMLEALRSGDEVLTSGGIYGTITNVKDDRFVLRIADNTKIEVSRPSISSKASSNGDKS